MVLSRAKRIYTPVIIIGGIAGLILLIFLVAADRESLIHFVLLRLQRPYLSGILEQQIITENKFRLLKQIGYGLMVADAVLVGSLYYFRGRVIAFLKFMVNAIGAACRSVLLVFKNSPKNENVIFGVLLSIIFLRGLYYIIFTDLQYDEMWCYNYYTSRPFYLTLFSYANYPLYELSTHIFKWLPFPAKINLRLPALMAGIFSCVIIYACSRRITRDFLTALSVMGLFAAFPFATQFMIYAKGISLELFFAISSFFCVVFFLKGLSPKKYLLLYVLANGCGIYAMPTHVYWWILQWVFSVFYILVYRKKLLKSFLIGNMLVLLFGLFCYLPVIAGSGITFVTGAAWGPNDLPDLSPDTGSFILLANLYFTGSGYGFGIALLMAIVVLAVSKKYGVAYFFLIAFGLALLILPLAIRLLQHIHIPERAVGFVGLAMPIIAFIVFSLGKDFLPDFLRAGLAIFLFASMLLVSHFHSFRFWSAKHDKNAIAISNLMMQHHVIRCYDNAPGSGFYYYYPALEFYYAQHKLNIELSLAAPNSLRHKVFSVADDYDCLVDSLNANDAAYRNNYGVIYTDSGEGFRVLLKQGK